MNADTFMANFGHLAGAPGGVAKLREMILQLAVQGKLVQQDPEDEPAEELIGQMSDKKSELIKAGTIRKTKPLPPIEQEDGPLCLPNTWKWVRIGDAISLANGRAFKKSEWSNTGIPIIRIQNLNNPDAPFNYCDFEVDDKFHVRENDFLISWSGTPGTSFGAFIWKRQPAVLNQHIFRAEIFGNAFDKPFLRCAINSQLDAMIAQAHGGVGLRHITKGRLEQLPIPLPPLAEQKRIVAKVDELMALCDQLESQQAERSAVHVRLGTATLAHLTSAEDDRSLTRAWSRLREHFGLVCAVPENVSQLRQAILQLAVQGKLVEQDPEDEPASELIEEIHAQKQKLVDAKTIAKPKKLPKITPEALPFAVAHGWTWIRLESTCKVITKGSSPKWQGINYVEDSKDGVLFITSENVGTYTMRKLDEPKFVEKRFNEMETRSILQRNDILINLVGASIGRSALWDRADVANINQAVGIIRLVPDCRSLNLRYLLHYLNSPTCLAIMFENQVETARANISLTNVKHFLVPLPPLAEQKRIVAKVDELMALCDALEAQLTQQHADADRLSQAMVAAMLNHSVA